MLADKDDIQKKVENLISDNKKILKMTGYIAGGIAGVYILGQIFKLLACSIRGFNDFKNSIRGK